ncbi:hypothetical protein [Paludibacterium purpuratum]|uniref:Putative transposase/invertase (TIGR01784 family) n=1 Tax=Paludibacterium purpuratum TaxID=1144873 RepID=A0A4R7BGT5_9NEIS|nr:hypothetical protein [Paludibacterium purpuratum]TDR82967.1 putative transposase/invertase (TIGR01784 family) [Paludibacterium purpuratum]
MTMAERLRQEWVQEGIEKGIEKGTLKTRKEVAYALLTKGVDRTLVMQCTGLTEQELDQLGH